MSPINANFRSFDMASMGGISPASPIGEFGSLGDMMENPFGMGENPMAGFGNGSFETGMLMGMMMCLMALMSNFSEMFGSQLNRYNGLSPGNFRGLGEGFGMPGFGDGYGGGYPGSGVSPGMGGGYGGYPTFNPGGMTGDPNAPPDAKRQAAINWATSQLGVSESNNPDTVRGYSHGRQEAWCADFVSTALQKAGMPIWGYKSKCSDIWDWAGRNGRQSRSPQAGDAIIYDYKGKGPSHIALVKSVNGDGTITTVGGNEHDAVRMQRVSLNNRAIVGFVKTT